MVDSQTTGAGGEDLLCDAVDVDAKLAAVRVGVQVVRTEEHVRIDCWDETGDGNNRAGVCGLFGECVSLSCNVRERTGLTYCVRSDPDATVPGRFCVSISMLKCLEGLVSSVGYLPTGLMVVTLRIMVKACWRDGNPDNMFR